MSADYVPFRFYRICPKDAHTCSDRGCLEALCPIDQCPREKKPDVPSAPSTPPYKDDNPYEWC